MEVEVLLVVQTIGRKECGEEDGEEEGEKVCAMSARARTASCSKSSSIVSLVAPSLLLTLSSSSSSLLSPWPAEKRGESLCAGRRAATPRGGRMRDSKRGLWWCAEEDEGARTGLSGPEEAAQK